MKKMMTLLVIMFFVTTSIGVIFPQNAWANDTKKCSDAQNGTSFLGFPAWYRGLVDEKCEIKKIDQEKKDGAVTIQQFVWTIIGNVFDGIFRILGVVAVGFIVWSGIQYMISAGDSGKMAKAKTTLTNAIVGLIIAVIASGIVQLVMGVL